MSQPGGAEQMPPTPFTQDEQLLLKHTYEVISVASLITSAFVVLTYLVFERKRRYPQRLSLYFALPACALSAALTIPQFSGYGALVTNNALCLTQAFFIQYMGTSTICWWFCIVVNLYDLICREQFHTDNRNEKRFLLFSLGFPVLLTLVPMFTDNMGYLGLWCWIKGVKEGSIQFSFFYAVMGLLLLVGTVLWTAVMVKIHNVTQVDRFTFGRHVVFVFVFFAIFITMFVHRAYQAFHPKDPVFALELGHAIALSSIGLDVFIVLGTTQENLLLWKHLFLRLITGGPRGYDGVDEASVNA